MQVRKAIGERRATREFSSAVVSCGVGHDLQPGVFAVVPGRDRLAQYSDQAKAAPPVAKDEPEVASRQWDE